MEFKIVKEEKILFKIHNFIYLKKSRKQNQMREGQESIWDEFQGFQILLNALQFKSCSTKNKHNQELGRANFTYILSTSGGLKWDSFSKITCIIEVLFRCFLVDELARTDGQCWNQVLAYVPYWQRGSHKLLLIEFSQGLLSLFAIVD